MGFGNSEQNFGMIASKLTVAMWYTHRCFQIISDFTDNISRARAQSYTMVQIYRNYALPFYVWIRKES